MGLYLCHQVKFAMIKILITTMAVTQHVFRNMDILVQEKNQFVFQPVVTDKKHLTKLAMIIILEMMMVALQLARLKQTEIAIQLLSQTNVIFAEIQKENLQKSVTMEHNQILRDAPLIVFQLYQLGVAQEELKQ